MTKKNGEKLWKELEFLPENTDKYEYLLEIGQGLEKLTAIEKNEDNLVAGCFSKVWCVVRFENGKIFVKGEGKSQIINGVLALIFDDLNGEKWENVLNYDLEKLKKNGLIGLLTPTRANGILNVVKFIKEKVEKIRENEEK